MTSPPRADKGEAAYAVVDHVHHRVFNIAHVPAGVFVTAQHVCISSEVDCTHVNLDDVFLVFCVWVSLVF